MPALAANPYAPKPDPPGTPVKALQVCAGLALITAVAAAVSAAAEGWRYALLLEGRHRVLDAAVAAHSDELVASASFVAMSFGLAALLSGIFALSQLRPDRARSLLIPVVNLVTIGLALAEVQAQRRNRGEPTGLARCWQFGWLISGVLAVGLLIARGVVSSAQARANLVLGHLILDAMACVVGVLTAVIALQLARRPAAPRRQVVLAPRALPVP